MAEQTKAELLEQLDEANAKVAQMENRFSALSERYQDVMRNNAELSDDNDALKGKMTHNVFVENGLRARLNKAESEAVAHQAQVNALISTDDRVQLIYSVVHRGFVLSDGRLFVKPDQRVRVSAEGDGSVEITRDLADVPSMPELAISET